MPRFMTLIRVDENNIPEEAFGPEFEQRMNALFEEITKAGVMLDTAGLAPTSQGTRMTWSGGKVGCTDGPFTETKEVVGGYSIIQAKDKAEAMEWTRRFLEIHPAGVTLTAEVREIAEDGPEGQGGPGGQDATKAPCP
ncbi:YciI family protein [Streptomyces sp. TRM 70361]|uniref:YciI family protein n=1 Tax=Streptomyces sp. TRM 70361 TaxID=3116553 RepID=UPI002E7B0BC1|nr:YciI family protein [Streptomyces sp. TRM 70361]MEE1939708.1 YciI family protein [Streptomyces sp. TRM 70361]